MSSDIPHEILNAIQIAAKKEWPDDIEVQQEFVDSESHAYRELQTLDFGEASSVKESLLTESAEFNETWESRLDFIKDEIKAVTELGKLSSPDMPASLLAELKLKTAAEHDWYVMQLDEVRRGIKRYQYIQQTRAKVGPIRDILTRMESIIGAECYNNNIQNYGPGGVWEGEGRAFRYPVTFIRDGREDKRWTAGDDLQAEELATGFYKFGANELSIYRALVRIIDMLEADYGFKVTLVENKS